ncbi:MAG: glycosyl hydrolase [Saprospiraceae bacterium]|nr:glycosyl hydrolase [Saprospiraceae bacterium]
MNTFNILEIDPGRGICYSGFRDGQNPGGVYPDYNEIKEDLLILQNQWDYLRLYDCDQHADIIMDVITNENLNFKIMLGAYLNAEMNNFNCPWGGGVYTHEQLEENCSKNQIQVNKLIEKANKYPGIIFSLSVGNEACVDWTDHYVSEMKVAQYVRQVKDKVSQPVTFCENYVPWLHKLEHLASELDFISIHTYPVWEYKHIEDSLDYTKENYYSVVRKYPEKPVVITEAGWATNSNGRGINPESVSEDYQKMYFEKLMEWVEKEDILTFYFEAFDESWKGSSDPLEPEKHWGLYKTDRTPKKAVRELIYSDNFQLA